MAKRKIILNVAIGATVGALVSLLNKDTRHYTKEKAIHFKNKVNDVKENPDKAVRTLRTAVEKVNHTLENGTTNVLSTLDKIQDKLD